MKKNLSKLAAIAVIGFALSSETKAQNWLTTGNAGTDTATKFVGTTDAVGLKIKTNNIDRVWVGTNGRVGIGTNAPVNNLDVVNNGAVTSGIRSVTAGATMSMDRGLATANAAFAYKSLGVVLWNSGILGNDNFTIRNAAAGTNVMIITPANNVGIGTGAPSQKLDVNGNVNTSGNLTASGNVTAALNMSALGNLGVGTTTPAAKLDVTSTSSYVAQFNGIAPMYMGIFENGVYRGYWGSYSGNAEDVDFGTGTGNTTGKLHFAIQGAPKMTVDNAGQVGIGTTSPGYYLDIQASNTSRALNAASSYVGSVGQIVNMERTSAPSTANDILQITVPAGSPADFQFIEADKGGSNRFQVNGDGSVGVGFSTLSTARLNVDGSNVENKKLYGVYATTDSATSSSVAIYGVHELVGSNVDAKGVYGKCVANPGYGYGVYGEAGYTGVRGLATATTYTGSAYGVYGSASGSTAGTRIGVYGTASGGSSTEANWGGYFPTKLYANEIRIGTTNGATGYIASIGGKLIAEEVRVALEANWPDYVFNNNYKMLSLDELEGFVKEYNHLPGVPSACEVEENGLHLGQMQSVIMEKTEENTLYILQLKKEINELKAQIQELKNK